MLESKQTSATTRVLVARKTRTVQEVEEAKKRVRGLSPDVLCRKKRRAFSLIFHVTQMETGRLEEPNKEQKKKKMEKK